MSSRVQLYSSEKFEVSYGSTYDSPFFEVMDAVELLQDDCPERPILVVFFQSKRGWRTYSQRNPQRNTRYAADRSADIGAVDITKRNRDYG
jgi:hypothetical protein